MGDDASPVLLIRDFRARDARRQSVSQSVSQGSRNLMHHPSIHPSRSHYHFRQDGRGIGARVSDYDDGICISGAQKWREFKTKCSAAVALPDESTPLLRIHECNEQMNFDTSVK